MNNNNNKYLFSTIICLLWYSIGITQGYETNSFKVRYNLKVNISFLDSILHSKEANPDMGNLTRDFITALYTADPIDIYYLDYSRGESRFYYDTTNLIYSFSNDLYIEGSRTTIFKNHSLHKICQISNDQKFESDMPDLNDWQIINGRDTSILGYNCNYAEWIKDPKENIGAWFAQDIPVQDGPATFCGLPGLVLLLITPTSTYLAKEISFNVIGEIDWISKCDENPEERD